MKENTSQGTRLKASTRESIGKSSNKNKGRLPEQGQGYRYEGCPDRIASSYRRAAEVALALLTCIPESGGSYIRSEARKKIDHCRILVLSAFKACVGNQSHSSFRHGLRGADSADSAKITEKEMEDGSSAQRAWWFCSGELLKMEKKGKRITGELHAAEEHPLIRGVYVKVTLPVANRVLRVAAEGRRTHHSARWTRKKWGDDVSLTSRQSVTKPRMIGRGCASDICPSFIRDVERCKARREQVEMPCISRFVFVRKISLKKWRLSEVVDRHWT